LHLATYVLKVRSSDCAVRMAPHCPLGPDMSGLCSMFPVGAPAAPIFRFLVHGPNQATLLSRVSAHRASPRQSFPAKSRVRVLLCLSLYSTTHLMGVISAAATVTATVATVPETTAVTLACGLVADLLGRVVRRLAGIRRGR